MLIVLYVLSIIGILATVLPLVKHDYWMVRAADFPYVQLTLLIALVILAWLFFGNLSDYFHVTSLVLLTISLLFRLYVIFPYSKLSKCMVPESKSKEDEEIMKILSANVLMYNEDYQGLLAIVAQNDPDILLLVEADEKWHNATQNMLNEKYGHAMLCPLNNTYGLLLYSKFEMSNSEVRYLIEDEVPSFTTLLTLKNGKKIQFYGLHPKPPSPSENEKSTPRDAELITVGKEARSSKLPVIVAGDMNDVAWSHTTRLFIRMSGLLDPRMGRGFFNTYHANFPFLRWPLDHIFISHHFKIRKMRLVDNFGSDHFPIYAELVYSPSTIAKDNIEEPDLEDRIEARDKLDEVG